MTKSKQSCDEQHLPTIIPVSPNILRPRKCFGFISGKDTKETDKRRQYALRKIRDKQEAKMKFDDAGRVQYLAIRSRLGVRQANMSTNLKLRGRTEDTWTCTKTKRTKRNKQSNISTNLNLLGHIEVT